MSITIEEVVFEGVTYPLTTFTSTERADYQGLKDMYYSEGGFKDGSYLERFPRESNGGVDDNNKPLPDFFTARKNRAHYENIFAPNIDAKVGAIFAKEQVRKIEDAVVEGFVDNPTKRRGETMSDYQQRKLLSTKIFEAVFEVLDGPPEIPTTGAPLQTYGYHIDNNGVLDMLAYFEDIGVRDDEGDGSSENTLRVWMKTSDGRFVSFLYLDELATKVKDNLESLPVDLIEDNTRYDSGRIAKSKYIGELSIAKAIYNTTSWFNDSFFKNCFAFLAIHGRIPDDVDLSNSSTFMYQGDGVNAPAYVAPPVAHLETMIKEVVRLVQQLNSNMNSVLYISVMASGEARKEADKTRIQQQKQDAKRLEENESWLVNIALKNYIDFKKDFTVLYIKDYESLTKADEIEPLQGLIDSGALKQDVIYLIGEDMIDIVYSSNPERAKKLKKVQEQSVDETQNDTFDNPPTIEE